VCGAGEKLEFVRHPTTVCKGNVLVGGDMISRGFSGELMRRADLVGFEGHSAMDRIYK
jgi:hypothetical protein